LTEAGANRFHCFDASPLVPFFLPPGTSSREFASTIPGKNIRSGLPFGAAWTAHLVCAHSRRSLSFVFFKRFLFCPRQGPALVYEPSDFFIWTFQISLPLFKEGSAHAIHKLIRLRLSLYPLLLRTGAGNSPSTRRL